MYTQLPWYWQAAMILVIAAIVIGVAWATFLLGKSFAFRPLAGSGAVQESAEQRIDRVERENQSLRGQIAVLEQRIQIEKATQSHIEGQLKALTEQNARIKEELAFFQALGSAGGGVAIQRFTVSPEPTSGEFRFRLLVVQSKQRAEHFRGRVELVAYMADKGKEVLVTFPSPGEKGQPYVLGFKFFQRLEGVFKIPPDARLQRVEARVLEGSNDSPVTTQVLKLG